MEAVLTLYSVCIEESPLFEEQCKMRLSLKGEKRKKEKFFLKWKAGHWWQLFHMAGMLPSLSLKLGSKLSMDKKVSFSL